MLKIKVNDPVSEIDKAASSATIGMAGDSQDQVYDTDSSYTDSGGMDGSSEVCTPETPEKDEVVITDLFTTRGNPMIGMALSVVEFQAWELDTFNISI